MDAAGLSAVTAAHQLHDAALWGELVRVESGVVARADHGGIEQQARSLDLGYGVAPNGLAGQVLPVRESRRRAVSSRGRFP